MKFAFGFTFGGSITSIVRLIVAVPPSMSSTSSEIVYVPPAGNDRDGLEPVWSSNAPSLSRSHLSARIRSSGSLASELKNTVSSTCGESGDQWKSALGSRFSTVMVSCAEELRPSSSVTVSCTV